MKISTIARLTSAFLLTLSGSFFAAPAQVISDKPIQYVIAFPPGGESDVVARLQADLSFRLYQQQMIVLNKAGAGGGLAWSQMNNYPNDGTSIVGINLPHIVLQPLQEGSQFKTEDISGVYYYHFTPDALMVSANSPYKTYQDFIDAAKKNPGKLTLAGSGQYAGNQMAAERLNRLAGIKINYVPFKGTGDLISSLIGMHVDGTMGYLPLAIQQKEKVRTLAIATEKRHPALPDVPTFKELGLNWVDGGYRGIGMPKSTPEAIKKKMSDFMAKLNSDPKAKAQLEDGGFVLVDVPYEKIQDFMAEKTPLIMNDAQSSGLLKH